MNTEKVMLEAIFGVCCNNPQSLSYIKDFVADGLIKGGYVEHTEIEHLQIAIDETLLDLRQAGFIKTEYYLQDEFYVRATDKFMRMLYPAITHERGERVC